MEKEKITEAVGTEKKAEKKPARKTTTARKTTAKKTTAKKAAKAEVSEEAAAKPAAKKTTAKKTATRKTTAKKTTAKKTTDKKTTAKKSATKKTTTKTAEKKPARKKEPALKVLFVSPEVTPFANSGGLGEVASSLPKALCRKGVDCRVIMPLYGQIGEEYRRNMKYLGYTYVNVKWRSQYMGLFLLEQDGVKYYFVDNEYYFKRPGGLYGYFDDGERFAFFSRAVFDALELMEFDPQIDRKSVV